jgi:hypothetical protein
VARILGHDIVPIRQCEHNLSAEETIVNHLTYLRGRIETIRNVALFFALGMLSSVQARAQSAPTFKGHTIGETLADYLTIEARHPLIENHLPLMLSDCEPVVADPKTEKKARARLGYTKEKDLLGTCQRLLKLRDGEEGSVIPDVFGVSNPGEFSGGRLVSLMFYLTLGADLTSKEIRDDMQRKLGPPTHEGQETYQNGFGGKFDFPWAVWDAGKTSATFKQQDRDSVVVVVWDTEWQKKQKKEERPSSLD